MLLARKCCVSFTISVAKHWSKAAATVNCVSVSVGIEVGDIRVRMVYAPSLFHVDTRVGGRYRARLVLPYHTACCFICQRDLVPIWRTRHPDSGGKQQGASKYSHFEWIECISSIAEGVRSVKVMTR